MKKVYTLTAEKLLVQSNFVNETATKPRGKNVEIWVPYWTEVVSW